MLKHESKNRTEGFPSQMGNAETLSRLGPGLIIAGELQGEEDFRIEGHFKGKISLQNNNLIVEKNGRVEAEIHVKNIIVRGQVTGNVFASEKTLIEESGQMKGDISASRISIMDGAQFIGSVRMEKDTLPLPADEDASV